MHNDRRNALRALLDYALPLDATLATLAAFGWDVTEPLVFLSTEDIEKILLRYLSGELTSEQVTDWADLVECRDDIDFLEGDERLATVIFWLANPYLNEPITQEFAKRVQDTLRNPIHAP